VVLAAIGVFALAARPVGAQDAEQPETQQAQGASLYLQHCSSCHGIEGNGTFRGPTLIGVGAASADYWVRSGRMPLLQPDQEAKRGEPAFSDEEIRALVDHVAAFGEGPPIPELDLATADLATGGELYRLNCASCHNWDGKGGALIGQRNAPPLHPAPNRQVAEAIRIGPGSMPQFTSGQLDDKELNDVVAYVDYLRAPRDAGGYGLAHWGPSTETIAAFVGMLVLVLVTVWLGERRG
jgi:ubiquinol-cytochrome c reductase cytochrome c subunit